MLAFEAARTQTSQEAPASDPSKDQAAGVAPLTNDTTSGIQQEGTDRLVRGHADIRATAMLQLGAREISAEFAAATETASIQIGGTGGASITTGGGLDVHAVAERVAAATDNRLRSLGDSSPEAIATTVQFIKHHATAVGGADTNVEQNSRQAGPLTAGADEQAAGIAAPYADPLADFMDPQAIEQDAPGLLADPDIEQALEELRGKVAQQLDETPEPATIRSGIPLEVGADPEVSLEGIQVAVNGDRLDHMSPYEPRLPRRVEESLVEEPAITHETELDEEPLAVAQNAAAMTPAAQQIAEAAERSVEQSAPADNIVEPQAEGSILRFADRAPGTSVRAGKARVTVLAAA